MTCAEIRDYLWEDPHEQREHLRGCAGCARALEEINVIRSSLREGRANLDRLAAGVIARMSRRRPLWPHLLRYAAGLLVGGLGMLFWGSQPLPPEPLVRIIRQEVSFPRLNDVLVKLGSGPKFEEEMIVILNETLRRRSIAVAPLTKKEVLP